MTKTRMAQQNDRDRHIAVIQRHDQKIAKLRDEWLTRHASPDDLEALATALELAETLPPERMAGVEAAMTAGDAVRQKLNKWVGLQFHGRNTLRRGGLTGTSTGTAFRTASTAALTNELTNDAEPQRRTGKG